MEGSGSGRWWRSTRSRTRSWVGGGPVRRVGGLSGRCRSRLPVVDRSRICLDSLMMPRRRIDQCWWERQLLMRHKTTFRGRPGGRLESSRPRQTFDGHKRGNSRETSSNPCSFFECICVRVFCMKVMLSRRSKGDFGLG